MIPMPAKPKAKRTPHLLSLRHKGEFVVRERMYGPWALFHNAGFSSEDMARGLAIYRARFALYDVAVFRRAGKNFVRVGPIYNGSLKGDKRIRDEE